MRRKNRRYGIWYWLTISSPSNYWMAKVIGGKAEEEADTAMEDVAQAIGVVVILIVLGFIGFWLLRALGVV